VSVCVCLSVCLLVGHIREPRKDGRTDRGAVEDINSGSPSNHALGGAPDPPKEGGNFGETSRAHCELEGKYSLESTDPRESKIRARLRP